LNETVDYNTLERMIRNGHQPDNPCLLDRYLALGEARASAYRPAAARHAVHMRTYTTLLETICDSCIATHWRVLCLDQIYKPLIAMERLASTQTDKKQIRKLHNDLSVLSHYFL
uniref:hypothetical protein n=1 Tax=Pontibacterium sp. TaxID=2036026 RepID=UPI0035149331